MQRFTESNITLNFPDNNFFRFESCVGYRNLSSHHFKEMDACWYDSNTNVYWLFELKDYSIANLSNVQTIDSISWDIAKKAFDSLSMMLSNKHLYPYFGLNTPPCLPVKPNDTTEMKFIVIIHCDISQKPGIQLIHEKFRHKFKPYAELFGIKHYGVVEHSKAITNIPYGLVT
jgi:hypothetical protein